MLGIKGKFLEGAVDAVVEIYRDASDFGELVAKHDYIKKVISIEEDRFAATLNQGMDLLDEEIKALKADGKEELPGEVGFRLYDTFGFPWELTEEILHENGLDLDKEGFDKAMNEQRERARNARAENQRVAVPDLSGIDVSKLTVDPEAKRRMLGLAQKVETEVDESWYEDFYHHLRMEMDEYRRLKRSLRVLKSYTDYEEDLYEEAV